VVNGTIVAVGGPSDLQGLGQLDLTIRGGSIIGHAFQRHVPTAADPEDPAVRRVLEDYLARR
jgi:hypothetical protein